MCPTRYPWSGGEQISQVVGRRAWLVHLVHWHHRLLSARRKCLGQCCATQFWIHTAYVYNRVQLDSTLRPTFLPGHLVPWTDCLKAHKALASFPLPAPALPPPTALSNYSESDWKGSLTSFVFDAFIIFLWHGKCLQVISLFVCVCMRIITAYANRAACKTGRHHLWKA